MRLPVPSLPMLIVGSGATVPLAESAAEQCYLETNETGTVRASDPRVMLTAWQDSTEAAISGIAVGTGTDTYFQATYGKDGLFVSSLNGHAFFRSGRQVLKQAGGAIAFRLPDGGVVYVKEDGVFRLDAPTP